MLTCDLINIIPCDIVSGSRYITALKVPLFLFSFAITAAGVVMCVGRKSLRTSSISTDYLFCSVI